MLNTNKCKIKPSLFNIFTHAILLALISVLVCAPTMAQIPAQEAPIAALQNSTSEQPLKRELVIGTKTAPPFVIKNSDGSFEGISIDLWKQMATNLNFDYRFEEADLLELLDGLARGRFDASIAAITVTANRETQMDFTHPFFTTGLAIAISREESSWTSAIERIFSWEFLAALSGLCIILLALGFLLWLFERKKNEEMFGGSPIQGLGASF